MFRSIVLAVVLLVLVTGTALASHQTTQPDNYCTTVDVVAVVNAGYNVTATGAGRYARIRDLTTATTVIATDFGAGATTYTWTGLTAQQLPMAHQYQVQVSHTSLTTGYSTSGCLFTPPMPQAVVIERFEVVKGAFEWDATEDGLGYQVFDAQGRQWTPYIPAMSPGKLGLVQLPHSSPCAHAALWYLHSHGAGHARRQRPRCVVRLRQRGGDTGQRLTANRRPRCRGLVPGNCSLTRFTYCATMSTWNKSMSPCVCG